MSEIVSINIPAKAEHLLVVRLAASGICSRLGMGIEQMEDVKAAVAEACLIMIHDKAGYSRLAISFEYSDELWVSVAGEGSGSEQNDDEIDADFSLVLLEALTDKTEVAEGVVRFMARGGSKR
jgi:serine/threonine-protein kinase RsbW